ncbi:MAG: GIY-YIG nuclease family protein [Chitinophagaceae bacterium]|nr:MAG: GIY-YIG nuclease family protein [Chitinophagaceae bacterium]
MQKGGVVYILTNYTHTALYTGVTSHLLFRMIEHREKLYPSSFSSRYNVNKLVYFCIYARIEEAIAEEKRIKAGSRLKKIKLVEGFNLQWKDLWEDIKEW